MHNSQHNSSSWWNPANKGQEHSRNVVDGEMKIYENIYDCLEHRVETSGSVMSFEKAEEKIDIALCRAVKIACMLRKGNIEKLIFW